MKFSIISVILLVTGVSAFAPPSSYKSTIATTSNTSLNAFGGKKDGSDKGGFKDQLRMFANSQKGSKKNSPELSMTADSIGSAAADEQAKDTSVLMGRAVSWVTTLVSAVGILLGVEAQIIKTYLFGFVPSSLSIITTPISWFLAVGTFEVLPVPLAALIAVICAVVGMIGIPSLPSGKSDSAAPADTSDSKVDPMKIVKRLGLSIKRLVLLFLAFGEAVVGLSPVVDNKGKFWDALFEEECTVYPPPEAEVKANKFPKEKWIYINGIATDKKGALTNGRLMNSMFGRPVHVVHNPTDGPLLDVLECIAGKTELIKYGEIEPRQVLMKYIKESLKEAKASGMEKVVLIAHSQGTIITGNTLRLLGEDPEVKDLMKDLMEVYTFAGCAHRMPGENVKYHENMSNAADTVAWLGHVCPSPLKKFWRNTSLKPIEFTYDEQDKSIVEDKGVGHLLVSHYLTPMRDDGKFAESRLATEYLKDGKKN